MALLPSNSLSASRERVDAAKRRPGEGVGGTLFPLTPTLSPRGRGGFYYALLIRHETVQETVATGASQVRLAATAVGAARGVRRVPRFRRLVVTQPHAVVMPDHGAALFAARPVLAGTVLAGRERGAVALRAGQDVVPVLRVTAAADDLAL